MRLFIAINFDEATKRALLDICDSLSPYVRKGRFTRADNLHLTLVFLGEIPGEHLGLLKDALSKVEYNPFTLKSGGIGFFRQSGGDLYWLGIEKSQELLSLNFALLEALKRCKAETGIDFHPDTKAFKPHLTLGRGMVMDAAFDAGRLPLPKICVEIGAFSLMESKSVSGRLNYKALYTNYFPHR